MFYIYITELAYVYLVELNAGSYKETWDVNQLDLNELVARLREDYLGCEIHFNGEII